MSLHKSLNFNWLHSEIKEDIKDATAVNDNAAYEDGAVPLL